MPPRIATAVYMLLILWLFAFDRERNARASGALWIPAVWIFIAASRSVSEWLTVFGFGTMGPATDAADPYLDGSPVDRFVFIVLLVLGLIVLARRGTKVTALLQANLPLVLFFLYCAVSVLWSDFPDVAFKRWSKALGDVVMILIVLTDANPFAAVKRILARVGFFVIPLSVLFIKYYPDLGRAYDRWAWTPSFSGITAGKNLLGMVCMIFAIGSVWRFRHALSLAPGKHRSRPLLAHGVVLVMAMWLFWMANSMTSLSCFLMASVLILGTSLRPLARKTWVVHVLVVAILSVAVSVLFVDVGSGMLETMGRDPSLTGRTAIWGLVLGMAGNPLIGVGFESFWLGPRLQKMWSLYWWHPNEAHNGYLEVYLNLGWIGVALLALLIVTGYRNLIIAYQRNPNEGRLRLAFFVICLAYNCTESAIRMLNPVWIFFLLAIIAVPGGWEVEPKTETEMAQPAFDADASPCLEEA